MWMVARAFVWLAATAGVANAGLQNDTTVDTSPTVTPALLFGPTAALKAPLLSSLVNGLVATPQGLKQWQGLRSKMAASPGGGALHLPVRHAQGCRPGAGLHHFLGEISLRFVKPKPAEI